MHIGSMLAGFLFVAGLTLNDGEEFLQDKEPLGAREACTLAIILDYSDTLCQKFSGSEGSEYLAVYDARTNTLLYIGATNSSDHRLQDIWSRKKERWRNI